jgi:hypothetical protein
MEIKIDLDLPSIIAQAVSAERIQPLVNKAIAEAVGAAIRDATDYSSPFRKALETQLKDAMPTGWQLMMWRSSSSWPIAQSRRPSWARTLKPSRQLSLKA